MLPRYFYSNTRNLGFIIAISLLATGCATASKTNSSSQVSTSKRSHVSSSNLYTCGGCPPAEKGKQLKADVALAKLANMTLADLPNGWTASGQAQKASLDRPFGVITPSGARKFEKCMGLTKRQSQIINYNADQVLNLGSPIFSSSTAEYQMNISSWIDMVRTSTDGQLDFEISTSKNINKCLAPLYRSILTSETGIQFSGSPNSTFSLQVQQQDVTLIAPAVGYIRTIVATKAGVLKEYLGYFTLGRVQGECSLVISLTGGIEKISTQMALQATGSTVTFGQADTSTTTTAITTTTTSPPPLPLDPISLVIKVMDDMVERIQSMSETVTSTTVP